MSKDISNYPTMNPTFQMEEKVLNETRATIVVSLLEQGYGHTLGNALRGCCSFLAWTYHLACGLKALIMFTALLRA